MPWPNRRYIHNLNPESLCPISLSLFTMQYICHLHSIIDSFLASFFHLFMYFGLFCFSSFEKQKWNSDWSYKFCYWWKRKNDPWFISDQASYTIKGNTNISHTMLQLELNIPTSVIKLKVWSIRWEHFFFQIMQSYEIKLSEKKTKQKQNNDKGR